MTESSTPPDDPRAEWPDAEPVDPLAALARGDRDAFVAAYRQHYDALCRFAYRYLRSRAAAEEVVHDVFLRLWLRRERASRTWQRAARGEGSAGRAYLYAAVRNEAIVHLRRARSEDRARRGAWEPAEADPVGPDTLEVAELAAAVQRAIDELPPRPREVLLLKWQRGLTNAQVADELRLARKTVEMHVTRAIAALRARLGAYLRRDA